MAQALAEWDRLIATQEGLAAGDRDSSPADSYRRHIERGVMYRMRGRFADALRELDAATAARPDASDAQLLKALVLEAMDRAEDAGRAFATAWTLDDRNLIKTYYMLTRPAAGTKADRERALNLLAEAYRRDALEVTRPASPPSITFALTLDAIPDGLSRTPIVGDSTTAEAFALVAQAKFAEAIAALRRPRSAASPEDADAPLLHFVSGQQAERLGEVGSARHHYEQALAGALLGRSALYVAIARLAQVEGNTTAAVDGLSNWRPSQPRRRLEHVVGPLGSCSRRRHAAGAGAPCANRRNLPGPDDRDLGDKARLGRHHASSRRLSHPAGQLVERHQRLLSTPVHDFVERRPRADRERGGPCVF